MQYWSNETLDLDGHRRGFVLEARAKLALEMISHFGVIAGTESGEDSAGRQRMALQAPATIVERCFAIADLFVAEAERRGEIRQPTVALEDAFAAGGRLDRIRTRASLERPVAQAKDVA